MSRKKNSKTQVVVVPPTPSAPRVEVMKVQVNNKKKKSRSARRRASKRRQQGGRSSQGRPTERSYFTAHILMPSLTGPFRQPRSGGSARTGLAMDQTLYTITGNATNTVQGVQPNSVYSTAGGVAASYAVANTTTVLGGGGSIAVGAQFPSPYSVADINVTAIDLVAYYTGNPLTVSGEVMFGSTLPLATTSDYASLFYYPGVVKFPVAELIQRPMRVAARKLSEVADEFTPVGTGNADIDYPFVLFSGLPTGGTVQILITRTFEYRSTTVAGNVVPYESVGPSHSGDVASWVDAHADVASRDSTLTEALPESYGASLSERLGFGSLLGGVGAGSALMMNYGRRIMSGRVAQGRQMDIDGESIRDLSGQVGFLPGLREF